MTKNNRGFSLIELLLVVALMAIAVGVTGDILISLIRSYSKSQVINEIEQNSNFLAVKFTNELRNARRVISITGGSSITFEDREGIPIIYTVQDGVITRRYNSGAVMPLTRTSVPYGVNVSCSGAGCFVALPDLNNDPQVIQINIVITQSGNPASNLFTGEINIDDTIVIRNTY